MGASLSFGGFFGFLFGMPRTGDQQATPIVSQPVGNSSDNNGGQQKNGNSSVIKTKPNTNLEEISDWLTKILVGAGLTQLSKIPRKLDELSAFVAGGMSDGITAKVFTAAATIFFGVCGFLAVFLWTRLYMAELLGDGTINALIEKDEEQQKKIEENEMNFKNILAERIIGRAMANPLVSERELMKTNKAEIEVAAGYVQNQDDKNFSPTDYLVLAYDASRTEDYKLAAGYAEKAIRLKPAQDMLWKIYNFLGLCYHYQQPKNWKPGDDPSWLNNAVKSYQAAINNKSTLEEELLAKANLAFVYLDAERYDDCIRTATDILSKENLGGERMTSICDLARIADAAARAITNDSADAAKSLNNTKNIAALEYLFNTDDLPVAALKVFATLPNLNQDVNDFIKKVTSSLQLDE